MSWLPMFNSFIFMVGLISLIFWKLWGVAVLLGLVVISIYFMICEVWGYRVRYVLGFWIFVFSEVAIFLTLFFTSLWYQDFDSVPISDSLELPFLGCFLLIGSSITATAFHYSFGFESGMSMYYFLVLTLVLGGSFIGLQMIEFYDCWCDWLSSTYYAVCFSIVGLHFSHVLIGLLGLSVVLYLGLDFVNMFHVNIVVWYWHFVDYIWLLVYTVVYLI